MKRALDRAIVVGLLGAALVVFAWSVQRAAAQSAQTRLTDPVLAEAFNRVSDRLMCQCGCNEGLRVCNHQNCPSAIPMRREIEKKLQAGETEDQIVQDFVDEYGLKVLSAPPASGFNLAAWVMPGFAILAGLLLIVHFAGHWITKRRASESKPSPDIDPELAARIERELKSLDG